MDPNAAYRMMAEHFNDREYSEAYDIASGLLGWLRNGGFLPDAFSDRRSAILATRAMLSACENFIEV
jgi:hypothetical protein